MDYKRQLASAYLQRVGISVPESDIVQLSDKQLLIKLEIRYQFLREMTAATVIQRTARMVIQRTKFLQWRELRDRSARMI